MRERNSVAPQARKPLADSANDLTALPSPRVLTPRAAAPYIGVAAQTLRKMRQKTNGPWFVKLGSRRVGYLVADLDAWLAARPRFESTSEAKAAARVAA